MEPFATLVVIGSMIGIVAFTATRSHRRTVVSRQIMLDECVSRLDDARVTYSGDGFPRLEGKRSGRRVVVELVPDTMTIKRLPQLWLSISIICDVPVSSSFAVLVRPSGNDFYSLTEALEKALKPSVALPWEVLVRGAGTSPQTLLDLVATDVGAILADPRVKEVAVTPRGLRIIRQACEGRRGEHLLLRQAVFDEATVSGDDFENLIASLEGLRTSIISGMQREHAR